ncbi:MAG: efflux RND transporter periplasmic adaptor subunit [Microscillaceae bacterium]
MDRVLPKKKWYQRAQVQWIGLGLILITLLLYQLLLGAPSRLRIAADKIRVAEVSKGTFQEYIAIDGIVSPIHTYYLDIVESGTVLKKYAEDGQNVKAGDTLLRLGNTTLQLDFMNRDMQLLDLMNERQTTEINMRQNELGTQTQLAEMEFQLKQAERIFLRNQQLHAQKMISQEEFFSTRDQYEYQKKRYQLGMRTLQQNTQLREQRLRQLDASISRMQRNLDLSQNMLDQLYVKAPVSGLLAALRAEVGEAKQAGENIGQIDDLSGFKVSASIDEYYIAKVYVGLKASVEIDGKPHRLTVRKVYPEVSRGEFEVEMTFDQKAPARIRRGQTLAVKLQLGDSATAILVPKGAFYEVTGGQWVFVLQGKRALRRPVQLGRQNPIFYEVVAGLQPGEKVLVSDYQGYEDYQELLIE